MRLFQYAYKLRDLVTFDKTRSPKTRHGLPDLLILLLAAEIEELLYRGLRRQYAPFTERLDSLRGRILMNPLIRGGGVRDARLPCEYFERGADWHLNQVLRTGVERAAAITEDRTLRLRMHRLATMFENVTCIANFGTSDIDHAERQLNRLTAACKPALTIIRLLHEMMGTTLDGGNDTMASPGFLFDMNLFFQRLLSRFLTENLTSVQMADEKKIRNLFAYVKGANPRKRIAPAPRPDYAIFCRSKLKGFADAKYRDVWERGLPPGWLYQLSIYALASPQDTSILLYATMATEAEDEKIEIQQPTIGALRRPAIVIVRPVPLTVLADLLDPSSAPATVSARQRFAEKLIEPMTRTEPRMLR
jgi:5-methylcytosine-specific restriction enzyme subunit McrC